MPKPADAAEAGGKPLVVIVDDHPAVGRSLSLLLGSCGYASRHFLSGEALLAAGVPANARCLILDMSMPGGMHGLELLERLRSQGVEVPALAVSGQGDIRMAVRALKIGAQDFIEKPYDDELLLDAVAGCVAQACRVVPGGEAPSQAWLARLSQRERQVMDAVVAGRSNKEIAALLGISVRTVEIHRATMMDKVGARSLSELLRMAFAAGLGN